MWKGEHLGISWKEHSEVNSAV